MRPTLNQRRVVVGTSLDAFGAALGVHNEVSKNGFHGVTIFSILNGYNGCESGDVAIEIGARGFALTVCSGSASGNDAIGYGLNSIRFGEVDVMVVGGADAPLLEDIFGGFCKFGVTTRCADPQTAMKPSDQHRDGFLLGEGAAFLVLEELHHALNRGAKIYAEVMAHGRSSEAYNALAPHPQGNGVTEAIEKALATSRLAASQIDYINAHGTATTENDPAESHGIEAFFESYAKEISISSTKPVTGHLLGAAGALETVICALAIEHGEIPPTINLSSKDTECSLDYVTDGVRKKNLNYVLNLNSGFGGKTSCLVLGKFR